MSCRYILFEKSSARGGYTPSEFDAMGSALDGIQASCWVEQNKPYRYCALCNNAPDFEVGFYILLEQWDARQQEPTLADYNIMGTVITEAEAMRWRDANRQYRTYKYVPQRIVQY